MPATEPVEYARRATHRPLLLVASAVAAGIVADRYVGASLGGLGLPVWWLIAALGVVVCYFLHRRGLGLFSAGALLLSFAALAGAWHHLCWNYVDDNGRCGGALSSLSPPSAHGKAQRG